MRIIMNNPALYNASTEFMAKSTMQYLQENAERINWRDEEDTAIDVGCADGNVSVLVKNFKPYNKNKFSYKKFIACDMNENMIKFAKERYADEDITFRVLDIVGDLPDDLKGGFNHVFSFNVFQWIKAHEKGFTNIYNLLTDDGDIYIHFFANLTIYSMYQVLAKQPKWSTWLKDVDIFVGPYQDTENPEKVVAEMLKKIGFKNVDVRIKPYSSYRYTPQDLKNLIQSVEPFNMPQDVFDEFIEEGLSVAKEHGFFNFNDDGIAFSYTLLILNANK